MPATPHLSRAQARAIDEICRDTFKIPTLLLMENAARAVALTARQILAKAEPHPQPHAPILILAGPGNNGGDGLAAARHLYNMGFSPTIALLAPDTPFGGDALVMYDIAQAMNLPIIPATTDLLTYSPALVIDALFGTGLTRPLGGLAHELAVAARSVQYPVLAVDLPSGLDADTGKPTGAVAFRATHTLTFVAPKLAFTNPDSAQYTGQVLVADIGAPERALEMALQTPPQAEA